MALAALPVVATAQRPPPQTPDSREMLSAASFGTRGDGVADDSTALQAALDAAFAPDGPGFLAIPPGTYKVTKPLRATSSRVR
jgi:polygalacturonase